MSGRIVGALFVGAIAVLIAVAIFRNGVEFGRWLRADVERPAGTSAEAADSR